MCNIFNLGSKCQILDHVLSNNMFNRYFFYIFQALNELCEGQGWGIEVTGGHIGSVTVSIPYEALLTKDSFIEVTNLTVTLRPKARENDGTSMLESMWSSMSSSMQLAQECLEKESSDTASVQSNAIEGLEKFAQIIDNGMIFNNFK